MKKIVLLSDTHSTIEHKLDPHLEKADEIWHAGDWGDIGVYDWLHSFGKELRGVYGNIDGRDIRAMFPEDNIFEVEEVKVWMTHIGGYPGKYSPRVREKLPEIKPNIFVCGHSHMPKLEEDKKNNLWVFNPGACGNIGFHKMKTALSFEICNFDIDNVKIIDLGQRGSLKNNDI